MPQITMKINSLHTYLHMAQRLHKKQVTDKTETHAAGLDYTAYTSTYIKQPQRHLCPWEPLCVCAFHFEVFNLGAQKTA